MYEDGATADLATTEDKYAEISTPAEKIFDRVKEMTARPEAVEALKGRLAKVGELMEKWEKRLGGELKCSRRRSVHRRLR